MSAAPVFSFSTTSQSSFTVVSFSGQEAISALFRYEIDVKIAVADDDIDEVALLDEVATFELTQNGTPQTVQGVLASFEFTGEGGGYHYYTAVLVPEWWKASLGSNYKIFKNLSANNIISQEVSTAHDAMSGSYDARDFVCQFNESNHNFISRLAEHYGIYYFFDFSNNAQLTFADDAAYDDCPGLSAALNYAASASGDSYYSSVTALRKKVRQAADYISIIDNDPDQPSQAIKGSAGTEPTDDSTEVLLIDENVDDSTDADTLAQIRLEEIQAGNIVYEGQSGSPHLRPGFAFDLTGHSKSALNMSYLLTEVTHQGSNLDAAASSETPPTYQNSFKAIDSALQYRPSRVTARPNAASVKGWVHSETDDTNRAERDTEGRYRVRFGFFEGAHDLGETVEASHFIRKQQPVAGPKDAMDVPLPGGVEVRIGFINGNPDKPYIKGAMYDADSRATAAAQNTNNAVIQTQGLLAMISSEGQYTYSMSKSGAIPSDAGLNTIKAYPRNGGVDGDFYSNTDTFGERVILPFKLDDSDNLTEAQEVDGNYNIERKYGDMYELYNGDKIHWHNGNIYDFGGYWNYNLGNSYEENFIDQEAPLNTKVARPFGDSVDLPDPDFLQHAGPAWNSIKWPTVDGKVGKEDDVNPGSHGGVDIDTQLMDNGSPVTFRVNPKGQWDNGGLNVSKTFNESYEYTHGSGVSVSDRVNSLEVRYLDSNTKEIEMYFKDGKLREWTKFVNDETTEKKWRPNGKQNYYSFSGGGVSEEKKWDRDGKHLLSHSYSKSVPPSVGNAHSESWEKKYDNVTGVLISHSISSTTGGGVASMDFGFKAKATSEFSFGVTTAFSLSANAAASLSISASAKADIDISASASAKMELGVGAAVKLDLSVGPSIELERDTEFNLKTLGLKVKKKPDLEAAVSTLEANVAQLKMSQQSLDMGLHSLKLQSNNLKLDLGFLIFG